MIEIDTALLVACIAILTFVGGLLYKAFKIFAEHRDIPERVTALEDKMKSIDDLDVKQLNATLSDISTKMDTDYRQIQRISESQIVLIEGMMNLFRHVVDGNNAEEMTKSYHKMEMDLVRANMDVVK
jgi:hypothetical protein